MTVVPSTTDPLQWLRQAVGVVVDYLSHAAGLPRTFVSHGEFVGTVPVAIDELERSLSVAGFRWDPLSLYHHKPEGRRGDGSWAYRRALSDDRQLHVILFAYEDDRVDVFAHEEDSWLCHPIGHLRRRDVDPSRGVERTQAWLERMDVPYYQVDRWSGLTQVLPKQMRELIYGRRGP